MRVELITQFAIGNIHWRCVGDLLNCALRDVAYNRFRFAVAYMRMSGLKLIYESLQSLHDRLGHISGAIGIDDGFTTIEALTLLYQLSSDSTIVHTVSDYIYHPKIYLIEGNESAIAITGSANLTRNGLYRNMEVSNAIYLDLSSDEDADIYKSYDIFLMVRAFRNTVPRIARNRVKMLYFGSNR